MWVVGTRSASLPTTIISDGKEEDERGGMEDVEDGGGDAAEEDRRIETKSREGSMMQGSVAFGARARSC